MPGHDFSARGHFRGDAWEGLIDGRGAVFEAAGAVFAAGALKSAAGDGWWRQDQRPTCSGSLSVVRAAPTTGRRPAHVSDRHGAEVAVTPVVSAKNRLALSGCLG